MTTKADLEDLDRLLEIGRTHYMHIGYDVPKHPQVLILSEDGTTTAGIGMIGVPEDKIDSVLASLPDLVPLPFNPKWIAVTIDAYVDLQALKGEREVTKRPREAFNDGEPGVAECMYVKLSSDDSVLVAYQPYRWSPVDGWEWDKPIIKEEKV
jgi:hypothetical protein